MASTNTYFLTQVAAEAAQLLQQLVGRCVRLLFDETLLAALGDVVAVDDARAAGPSAQAGTRGPQRSLNALTQVARSTWCTCAVV